jgi:hypothetical protein
MPDIEGFSFPVEDYPEYYANNEEAGFDFFDRIPGTEYLTNEEAATAFAYFYEGFVNNESGISHSMFFDYMGMQERDFPWEEWREWMGYE